MVVSVVVALLPSFATPLLTSFPRKVSAVVFIFPRIMAETSSGAKVASSTWT